MTRLSAALLAAAVATAIAAPAASAATSWTPLGPFGGSVQTLTVAASDPRTLYASLNAAGLFRSADGGLTWTPIHAGTALSNVAVDPSRPATIYTYFDPGGLQKSTDGGGHWTPLTIQVSAVTALAVDPARPTRVYAGTSAQGVWRSTDAGASWQPARVNLSPGDARVVFQLAVPKAGGIVYAATDAGVFKSTDGALTWRSASQGLPAGTVFVLAAAPSDPKRVYASLLNSRTVYRTTNGGASWQRAALLPPAPPGAGNRDKVTALAVSPGSPGTVWAGTLLSGLFRTADGGAHWTGAGLPPQEAGVPAVAVAPSSPRTIYAGVTAAGADLGGVFASADAGASWSRRNQGLDGLDAHAVAAPPDSQAVLYAGLENQGLFRSGNQGRRWARVALPGAPASGTPLADVEIAPSSPATVYALALSWLWRSTDAGASWIEAYAYPDGPDLQFLRVDPADPFRLWGSTGFSPFGSAGIPLLRSTDGGDTWSIAAAPNLGCVVADLQFAPSSPSTLYEGGAKSDSFSCQSTQASLFRSTDGGATWTEADAGLAAHSVTALAVDPLDPQVVYAGTGHDYFPNSGDGVWKTTDGGASWSRAGEALQGRTITALAISPVVGVVWAAAGGAVFRSQDGGATWSDRTDGLQAATVYQLRIDPAEPQRIYAATSGGVWVLEDDAP